MYFSEPFTIMIILELIQKNELLYTTWNCKAGVWGTHVYMGAYVRGKLSRGVSGRPGSIVSKPAFFTPITVKRKSSIMIWVEKYQVYNFSFKKETMVSVLWISSTEHASWTQKTGYSQPYLAPGFISVSMAILPHKTALLLLVRGLSFVM